MGGQVRTFFGQLADQQSPCISETTNAESSSWLLWLLVGLVIGSLAFEKKGKTT